MLLGTSTIFVLRIGVWWGVKSWLFGSLHRLAHKVLGRGNFRPSHHTAYNLLQAAELCHSRETKQPRRGLGSMSDSRQKVV